MSLIYDDRPKCPTFTKDFAQINLDQLVKVKYPDELTYGKKYSKYMSLPCRDSSAHSDAISYLGSFFPTKG